MKIVYKHVPLLYVNSLKYIDDSNETETHTFFAGEGSIIKVIAKQNDVHINVFYNEVFDQPLFRHITQLEADFFKKKECIKFYQFIRNHPLLRLRILAEVGPSLFQKKALN
jgi:hypothetical protein